MVFVGKVVDYAKGNPLALKVVGSSLYCKATQDWENALNKLNKIFDPEILSILKISYDGLDKEEKNIFLDIACFFKGQDKNFVTRILDCCYFAAQMGLNKLVDKCLVTISHDIINMHDLLQEMGQELVCQESLHNPGKRSRLYNHEDISLVLRRNMDAPKLKRINLSNSRHLIRIPEFSNAPCLEYIYLKY
ncbi:hypothetical protein ACOSQ3_009253 [Xanthoceras sorbifolium]